MEFKPLKKVRSDQLTNKHLIAFALPSVGSALLMGPIAYILPTIYAKYYGMDLAFIGMVLMVARIFDGVTDPVIGYLSDKIRTPFGQRKPWIVVGYLLTTIAVYFLFVPPESVQPLYFLSWFMLLYLFLTIAEIPYLAWQSEITRDYQTRSKVSGYRTAFYSAGGLLFAVSPLLPIFDTHEMTPAVMKFLALVIAVSLPIFCLISAVFAPRGNPVATKTEGKIWIVLRDFVRNKPFMIFTSSYLLTGLGAGMQVGLAFLYFDTYLGLGNRFPEILFVMSAVPMLTIPIWLRLINKFGKHRAFAGGRILSGVFSIGLIALEPGPSVFPVFMVLWICMMSMYSAIMIISPAIVGDIVDYDLLKSGRNRAGKYNAVYLLFTKVSFGIGAGFAFYLLDIFGYDTAATIHDRTSTIGMWTAFIILPAVFYFISSVIMWFFPIDEQRHAVIRRRIEMRTQRANKNMAVQEE